MSKVNTIKTIVVKDFYDYLRTVNECATNWGRVSLWWRGQALSSWDLVPSIYRDNFAPVEYNMIQQFIHRAGVRYPHVPKIDEYSSWLFLMQHYGLPTRLLDWTESPLFALYFAVADTNYEDSIGSVWGLSPSRLNKAESNLNAIFTSEDTKLKPLIEAAFRLESGDNSVAKTIAAIGANHFDVRHMVQLSAFTIHGRAELLNHVSNAGTFLVKLDIPAEHKPKIRADLLNLGITESFLFPDLEHLARDIKRIKWRSQHRKNR